MMVKIFHYAWAILSKGVHRSSSPDQPAGPTRNRPATTRTDQFEGRQQVATHKTRTLRVGWWVSSPKTQATWPDHQIKTSSDIQRFSDKKWQIPTIFLLFRRRSTWNPPDPVRSNNISSRSSPDSMDPTKYQLDLAGSCEILAQAAKPETDRQKPEKSMDPNWTTWPLIRVGFGFDLHPSENSGQVWVRHKPDPWTTLILPCELFPSQI